MPINLSTFSPRACYSEGKRIAETLISTFSKINQLDIRIARVFNTYGPRLNINDVQVEQVEQAITIRISALYVPTQQEETIDLLYENFGLTAES